MTGADEFVRGKPVVYTGFDGFLYVATYKRSPIGHLRIARGDGSTVTQPIMMEHQARSFFWNLDR